jgi:hypothetical protein
MWEDPIVAEVHRAREKLAAECNYDIRAFFAGLRKRQMVQREQAEPTAEADGGRPSGAADATSSEASPAA